MRPNQPQPIGFDNLWVRSVPEVLKRKLDNMAWERGHTTTSFLRRHLKQWHRLQFCQVNGERRIVMAEHGPLVSLCVKNVPLGLKQAIKQESGKRGLDMASFLKSHLWQWVELGCPELVKKD